MDGLASRGPGLAHRLEVPPPALPPSGRFFKQLPVGFTEVAKRPQKISPAEGTGQFHFSRKKPTKTHGRLLSNPQ